MLDSSSQPKFQESCSFFQVEPIQNEQPSVLDLSVELLCESEQQTQYLIDSQFYHNFQNQLPYSPFQEEPIANSIKDMIQTRNFITQPINRLDSIMSELIKGSEKSLSSQLLVNPYIPNFIDWT